MKDLYLLADGTYADPKDLTKGPDGTVRNARGVHVALRDDGTPYTLGAHAARSGNVEAAKIGDDLTAKADESPKVEAPPAPLKVEDVVHKPEAAPQKVEEPAPKVEAPAPKVEAAPEPKAP